MTIPPRANGGAGKAPESIEDRAAYYVVRLDAGADKSEQQRIWDWIEQSPEHAVAFARAKAVWDRTGDLESGGRDEDSTKA